MGLVRLIVLVLAIAAYVKYLRSRRQLRHWRLPTAGDVGQALKGRA